MKLSREDAEIKYAELIMKYGNPLYFIYSYLRNLDDEYLVESLQNLENTYFDNHGEYEIYEEE